jgi:hypothetical protein
LLADLIKVEYGDVVVVFALKEQFIILCYGEVIDVKIQFILLKK